MRRACGAGPDRAPPPAAPLPSDVPLNTEPDRVTFQTERLEASSPGRLEVSGRWYGVRGRRFVRPTLTLTRAADGEQVRALADLDHKPWETQDGELWLAAFPVELAVEEASEIELSVAPDIAVVLRGGAAGAGGDGDDAAARGAEDARSPLIKARRAAGQAPRIELERFRERLSAATEALERERRRRSAGEQALEDERAENRRLRMDLGQLRAELELAQAAQTGVAATASELEAAQRELVELRVRADQLTRERDELTKAQETLIRTLHERTGALESARDALESAREALQREQERPAPSQPSPPAPDEPSGREQPSRPTAATVAAPLQATAAWSVVDSPPAEPAPARRRPAPEAPPAHSHDDVDQPSWRPRPLNPALRHERTYWFGRLLALLFLAAVVVAVILVVQGAIHH